MVAASIQDRQFCGNASKVSSTQRGGLLVWLNERGWGASITGDRMKTIAPDGAYIDYWHYRGYCCSGVRVWASCCRALASDPEQGPEGLMEYGEQHSIPVPTDLRSRRIGTLSDDPPIAGEILWHMICSPGSDLRQVVAGEKSFHEALSSAGEAGAVGQAASGKVS